MLEAIGGRKFLMSLIIMIAGVIIELKGANGLSVNMAGLLAAILATFSASNTIITNKQLKVEASEGQPAGEPVVAPQASVDELKSQLIPIINTIGGELVSIKDNQAAQMQATGVMQQTVGNISKGVSALLSLK